jgi:hypothetical protein
MMKVMMMRGPKQNYYYRNGAFKKFPMTQNHKSQICDFVIFRALRSQNSQKQENTTTGNEMSVFFVREKLWTRTLLLAIKCHHFDRDKLVN